MITASEYRATTPLSAGSGMMELLYSGGFGAFLAGRGRLGRLVPGGEISGTWVGLPHAPAAGPGSRVGRDVVVSADEARRRLMQEDPFGFASPPSIRVNRSSSPRLLPAERRFTRSRATTTTFGLWVKIPVTLVLIVFPLVTTVWDIHFDSYEFGPNSAADLFFNTLIWAVSVWVTVRLWAKGER